MCRWRACANQDPTMKGDINPGGSEQPGRDVLGPR